MTGKDILLLFLLLPQAIVISKFDKNHYFKENFKEKKQIVFLYPSTEVS